MRACTERLPALQLYKLTPHAHHVVLPLDDETLDALQDTYGRGEPIPGVMRLTSSDAAFAMKASEAGWIAYIETGFFGGKGQQGAALWHRGAEVIAPHGSSITLPAPSSSPGLLGEIRKHIFKADTGMQTSPDGTRNSWPINTVLQRMGIEAGALTDPFEAFGLANYRSTDRIAERATAVT